MSATLVIFPHQLFEDLEELASRHGAIKVILWDDPAFYGDRRGSAHGPARIRLNLLRIVYQRALILRYMEAHSPVEWVKVEELWKLSNIRQRYARLRAVGAGGGSLVMLDPADHLLSRRLQKAGVVATVADSPMFLTSMNDIKAWKEKTKDHKRLQQAPFYKWVKDKLGLLKGVASMDRMNRRPWRPGQELPANPAFRGSMSAEHRNRIWAEAKDWAMQMASTMRTRGPDLDPEVIGRLPLDSAEVGGWLRDFLDKRFAQFGPYEDAIVQASPWLYHSGLSAYMNFGLITPAEVLAEVSRRYEAGGIGLESYEGFVRQVAGWREYARLYYELAGTGADADRYNKNVFSAGMRGRGAPKEWYPDPATGMGGTGVALVDSAIHDAWKWGYLHHIRRLMIMSNAMTLAGLHPDDVFAWMYEFSLDSWDWVMVFNVYSMGTWSDGGFGMRKPYVSSSGYLKKMSHERLTLDERRWWDDHYADFVDRHKEVLSHTVLAGRRRQRGG